VKNAIGSGADIDVIVIGGGGATLYAEAFRRKFPKHQVVLLDHPAYANVRGLHILGEELARVANRALGQAIVHV
jgi:plasmid segregation protein ParM